MYFETFILTILFKNAKLNIKKKKKQPKFSTILGQSEKGKQTLFIFFFRPKWLISQITHQAIQMIIILTKKRYTFALIILPDVAYILSLSHLENEC